jgi:hypothetical protein
MLLVNKRRTVVSENWISYSRSLVESPALRVLSRAAILAMHRIELEHMQHGGAANGRLQVTRRQFEEWGVHRDSVGPALRELEALGFIEVALRGQAGVGGHGVSNHFRLTYVNSKNREQPTHEWRRVASIEDAERIARTARGEKDRRARDLGQRGARATHKKFFSVRETVADSRKHSGHGDRGHYASATETVATVYISGVGRSGAVGGSLTRDDGP